MAAGSDGESPFEVGFLETIQRLLAKGDFTATYKYSVIIALTELCVELEALAPSHFTTRQLAEKVADLYWIQSRPIEMPGSRMPAVLKQNRGRKPARIVADIAGLREATVGYKGGLLRLSL